jgi:hypothetical protein
MAAAAPPAGAGGMPVVLPPPVVAAAPIAPLHTFMDRYRDQRYDTENDSYQRLFTHFDPMSPHAFTAAQLWDSVLHEPDENSRAIAVHWQHPNLPNLPGRIVVLHGIKRYPRSPGGGSTPWDNQVYGWFQDVVGSSAPTSFELPVGNIFGVAEPTPGATTYRVYDPATLTALFAADPTMSVAPTPGAGAAGTMVVQTRYAIPIPFRYVADVLCERTDPRQFFERIYPRIVAEGRVSEMEPFTKWMCAACTARHDQNAGQVLSSVAQESYVAPPGDMDLGRHRQRLLLVKLPGLERPTVAVDPGIAQVGGQLISEIRQSREEARDRAKTVTTPREFYGSLLPKHLRLAQVATEGELQPIHHELARQNSHRKNRHTQQHFFETLCALHGKPHLRLPINPTLSDRLNTASWLSHDINDLPAGINTFMLGGSSQMEVQSQEELIALYDMASQSAGATFQDLQMVASTNRNVSIPTNHTFAKFDLQRLEMLMIMYWGANEATSAIAQFLGDYERHLHLLMDYRPTAPGHEALVPGLVLRYFQAHMNLWIHQQLASDSLILFPSGVHDIWTQLALRSHIWERPFPLRYITSAAPLPGFGNLAAPGGVVYGATMNVPPMAAGAPPAAAAPAPRVQETHRNMYPNGNEEAFKVYRTLMIGRKFKKVIDAGVQNGHLIPKNGRGDDMCVTFHVLGNCTSFCSRRSDHNTAGGRGNHTKADDDALLKWCKTCITAE